MRVHLHGVFFNDIIHVNLLRKSFHFGDCPRIENKNTKLKYIWNQQNLKVEENSNIIYFTVSSTLLKIHTPPKKKSPLPLKKLLTNHHKKTNRQYQQHKLKFKNKSYRPMAAWDYSSADLKLTRSFLVDLLRWMWVAVYWRIAGVAESSGGQILAVDWAVSHS